MKFITSHPFHIFDHSKDHVMCWQLWWLLLYDIVPYASVYRGLAGKMLKAPLKIVVNGFTARAASILNGDILK